MKSKPDIIGGTPEHDTSLACPHCAETLDGHETASVMTMHMGNGHHCVRCTKRSWLTANRTPVYWLFWLIGAGGFALSVAAFSLIIPLVSHTGRSYIISGTAILVGFLVGVWLWKLILKSHAVLFGFMSGDDTHQSILDFGQ